MKRFILYTIILFGLTGCYLKSVHPLITAEQSTFIEGLDGVYETSDQRWTFTSDPEESAQLLEFWDNEKFEFEPDSNDEMTLDWDGYLVLFENLESPTSSSILFYGNTDNIGDNTFLNLKVFDLNDESYFNKFIFRINIFSKISLNEDRLSLEFFKSDWIKNQILNNKLRIKHEQISDQLSLSKEVLITASTSELRKFANKYGNNENAFDDPISLNRVQNGL